MVKQVAGSKVLLLGSGFGTPLPLAGGHNAGLPRSARLEEKVYNG